MHSTFRFALPALLAAMALLGLACEDKNLDWVRPETKLVVLAVDVLPPAADPDRTIGDTVEFVVRVRNNGSEAESRHEDAPEFYVDLTIDDSVTPVAGSPAPLATNGTSWDSGTMRWTIPNLPKGPGSEATLTLTLEILAGATAQECLSADIVRPVDYPEDLELNEDDSDTECFDIVAPPAILLSSSTINFGALTSGTNPATQTVSVANAGSAPLTGLGETVSYAPGEPTGWLGSALDTTTAPATLTLDATTGVLAAGSYTATVSITAPVATNSPQDITVVFTVAEGPLIGLSTNSVAFFSQEGGTDPVAQLITVTNLSAGALTGLSTAVTYGAGQPTGWLDASLLAGNTAPAGITLAVSTGSILEGTYTATVAVSSPVAGNSPQNITVTFSVIAGPAIGLSTNSVDFLVEEGGTSPAARVVNVTNLGDGSLTGLGESVSYGAGEPTGWLASTLDTTTAPADLTLQPSTGGLAPGDYTATVRITSPAAGNSPQDIAVNLTVTDAPEIGLSTAVANFNAQASGSSPAPQLITVSNLGGGTLNGLGESVSYGGGEPTGWLSSTLNATTAPATLTLQATPGSLSPGSYNATVNVSSPVASNSPRVVAVNFVVSAGPAINLSVSTVSFGAQADGPNPGSQAVSISNGGDGVLSGLAIGISYGSGQPTGWLGTSLDATTAPAELTLQATTGTLPDGVYTATVSVSSAVATNSPRQIDVTFTVSAGPAIGLSTSSMSFNALEGGANPAVQNITVSNTGGGTLNGLGESVSYSAGQPTGWLSSTLDGTTAPAELMLQATPGALAAGVYTATVSVTSPAAANSPQQIAVSFTVVELPAIALSQAQVDFDALEGGANPGIQLINISNQGGAVLTGLAAGISYDTGAGWLEATLDATTAPADLTLRATTGSLADGIYAATVSVSAPLASNSPQDVDVTFTVQGPEISLSSTSASFTAEEAGGNPTQDIIVITNSGGGSLTGLGESVSYGAGEPTGWLSSTLSATTAPTGLTLQATTGGLAPGDYSAIVEISAPDAANSPQQIRVDFTVTPAPLISLSDKSLNFVAEEGAANPTAQLVDVTNVGGGTLDGLGRSISYDQGAGWLTASYDQSSAPAELTVRPLTGSLLPGVYSATVSVNSLAALNSPQDIDVTFTVTAAPSIGLSSATAVFSAEEATADPTAEIIDVTNLGAGTLDDLDATISYGNGSGWLSATLDVTTAPAQLTIQPTTGALAPDVYTATISVTSSVADNSPQDIDVTFTVTAAPSIGLSSATAVFSAEEATADPTAEIIDVTNVGAGTLDDLDATISYGNGSGWLSATLDVTTAPAQLTIQPTTGALVPDVYTATISVTSSVADNSPQDIDVTFTVTAAPSIGLSSATAVFGAEEGAADPTAEIIDVTNVGAGTLDDLDATISYGNGSGWLSATLDVTTAPAQLTIQPTTGALAPDVYTATISVTSSVADNSPQDIDVTFTVTAAPSIGLSSAALNFNAVETAGDPASQVVDVTNLGDGTLDDLDATISYGNGSGWLSATLDVTTAPAQLTIQPTTGALVADVYTATVSVTSGVADNTPQDITVTFTIDL